MNEEVALPPVRDEHKYLGIALSYCTTEAGRSHARFHQTSRDSLQSVQTQPPENACIGSTLVLWLGDHMPNYRPSRPINYGPPCSVRAIPVHQCISLVQAMLLSYNCSIPCKLCLNHKLLQAAAQAQYEQNGFVLEDIAWLELVRNTVVAWPTDCLLHHAQARSRCMGSH